MPSSTCTYIYIYLYIYRESYGRKTDHKVAICGIIILGCQVAIFIAFYYSLGPTENSIEDFWRMIWEGNIPTIVMLIRIFEGRVRLIAR